MFQVGWVMIKIIIGNEHHIYATRLVDWVKNKYKIMVCDIEWFRFINMTLKLDNAVSHWSI
jgi:hypothetical protein